MGADLGFACLDMDMVADLVLVDVQTPQLEAGLILELDFQHLEAAFECQHLEAVFEIDNEHHHLEAAI